MDQFQPLEIGAVRSEPEDAYVLYTISQMKW